MNAPINVLKGIGIILVIIGHSTMFIAVKDAKWLNVMIYAFHMPMFFIVGGFFLRINQSKTDVSKVVKRVLIPFITVTFFWAFLGALMVQLPTFFRSMTAYPIKFNWGEQLLKFIDALSLADKGHILGTGVWFLIAFFVSRILFYIIHGVLKLKITPRWLLILLLANYIIYLLTGPNRLDLYWMWPQGILGYSFMAFGYFFNKHKLIDKINSFDAFGIILLLIFTMLWNGRVDMASNGYQNYILFIFNALFSFVVVYKFSQIITNYTKVISSLLEWAGINSLNILLFHPVFLTAGVYSLMANFNIKDVYNNTQYLIILYSSIFLAVYFFERWKITFESKVLGRSLK